jgi:transcriptional regulator with XRE-family HTH domain
MAADLPGRSALPNPSRRALLSRKEVGARLRALRLERGFSQVQLSKLVGSHQTALSQIEVGRRGVSLQQVLRLCRALKVTPDRILGESNNGHQMTRLRGGRMMHRLARIETLPPAKQRALLQMVDAFIEKHGRPESARPKD